MNENEKAIEYFKDHKENFLADINIDGHIYHGLAIKALERQIPKKPNGIGFCNCGSANLNGNYCSKCGQKVDWN